MASLWIVSRVKINRQEVHVGGRIVGAKQCEVTKREEMVRERDPRVGYEISVRARIKRRGDSLVEASKRFASPLAQRTFVSVFVYSLSIDFYRIVQFL
jgi:hypothetical protein